MPVNAASIALQIVAAGPKPGGPAFVQLASAVGVGVTAWVAAGGVRVAGVSAGSLGVGTVTGKYVVVPSPLPVAAVVAASGIVGVTAPAVAAAVGIGIGTSMNTDAAYVGVCGGVGLGSDQVVAVYADVATLAASLSAAMAGSGIVGPTMPAVAAALAGGIAALVSTGTGTGAVSPQSVGPAPAVAASTSRLV
jgi:hypothetical protein